MWIEKDDEDKDDATKGGETPDEEEVLRRMLNTPPQPRTKGAKQPPEKTKEK